MNNYYNSIAKTFISTITCHNDVKVDYGRFDEENKHY